MKKKQKQSKVLVVSGKRKEAIAKAIVREGSGVFKINKYFIDTLPQFRKLFVSEPIAIAQNLNPEAINKI
ncbi:MAG: 30S ribosomal protein S9, partial [Nanoarchaeota archaeon]